MAIITISRGTLSGGQILAECVAERLGYRCIGREVLLEAASEYGIPEERLTRALRDKPRVLERLTSEREHYLASIRAALIREARNEKLVYHGHAGHLLLKDVPHVLRVRVIANIESRIKVAMDCYKLNSEEAMQFIYRVDQERMKWTSFLYHVDWHDPSLYDVVFNLDHISLVGACKIACQLATGEDYKATAQSRKIMDDLVLSSHLEAIIANNRSISGSVKIEADEGVVTLAGTVESLVDADRVKMMVRKAPGVKEINPRMKVRLPGVIT